jgi:hypothetical protein
MNFWNRLTLKVKIYTGFAAALFLIACIGSVALLRLSQIDVLVSDLASNLTRDENLSNDILKQFLLMRYHAQRYIQYQEPADLIAYNQASSNVNDLLAQAQHYTNQADQLAVLQSLQESSHRFDSIFEAIVVLVEDRKALFNHRLAEDAQGIDQSLATMRDHGVQAGQSDLVLHTLSARDAFLRMRATALEYLVSGNIQHAQRYELEYKTLLKALSDLRSYLDNPEVHALYPQQQRIYQEIDADLSDYYLGFHAIQADYEKQADLLANQGPGEEN